MGEIIEKVGQLEIAGNVFDIELNAPFDSGGEQNIHIQNERFRFECTKTEFMQIATLIVRAKENFDSYKNRI